MKHLSHLSARIAAKSGIRQVEAHAFTDGIGLMLDREIDGLIKAALASKGATFFNTYRAAKTQLDRLALVLTVTMGAQFNRLAVQGHRATTAALVDVLPLPDLQAAALAESLLEAVPKRKGVKVVDPRAGVVRLQIQQPAGTIKQRMTDAAKELKKRASPAMPKEQARQLYGQLLFPAPPIEVVDKVVYGGEAFGLPWWEHIAQLSKLAPPELLASTIATGYAAGKTHREIAKEILPMVDGVRSSARRIARTEGMRIAHDVQMNAWDELGDMVLAYQIHSVNKPTSRPWHALRRGTIYYKHPEGDQKGLEQMPRPPMEAPDKRERPEGTPDVAANCLCWLSPVLTPVQSILDDPVKKALFTDAHEKLVPDPATYEDWFATASEDKRRKAVGSRRYSALSDIIGGKPAWSDFLDHETGRLLPLDALKNESHVDRAERRGKVQELITKRRGLLQDVATFGFESTPIGVMT